MPRYGGKKIDKFSIFQTAWLCRFLPVKGDEIGSSDTKPRKTAWLSQKIAVFGSVLHPKKQPDHGRKRLPPGTGFEVRF